MAEFHFLRPWFFVALLPVILAIWQLKRQQTEQSGWLNLIPDHLAKQLIQGDNKSSKPFLFIPAIVLSIFVIALAGPTWEKIPQPVYQINQGSVIVTDMSFSMLATDLKPNRLTLGRYKTLDLLDQLSDGDVGLIAYAGEAFVISPLTPDRNNLKQLLPSLSPNIMPVPGSNPVAALQLAAELLANSGHIDGYIFWLTDGIYKEDAAELQQWLKNSNYQVSILAVGTEEGAPITMKNGELLKDNNGNIVIPQIDVAELKKLARLGSGNLSLLSTNNSDISAMLEMVSFDKKQQNSEQQYLGDQWQEAGPYLLLFVLPFVLYAFRRGILISVFPLLLLLTPEKQAQAVDWNSMWNNAWVTEDQQATVKFQAQDFSAAANQFKDPLWQGTAFYRAGEYEQALNAFQMESTNQAFYNQGNAQAKLGRFDDAIASYEKVEESSAPYNDAIANIKLLEKLMQVQQNEQNNDQESDSEQNSDQKSDQESKSDKSNNQQDESQQKKNEQDQEDQQDSSDQSSDQNNQQAEENPPESTEEQSNQNQPSEEADDLDGQQSIEQQLAENATAEEQEKIEQMLKLVTDDPSLLLRNRMLFENQKRLGQTGNSRGTNTW